MTPPLRSTTEGKHRQSLACPRLPFYIGPHVFNS